MSLKGLLKSGYSQIQEMDFDRPIEQYVERLGHYVINHGLPDLDVTFGDGVENLILTGIAKIDAAAGALVDFVTAHPGAAADFVTAHPGPAADIVSDILDGGLRTAALVVKSQLDAVTDADSTFDFGSIHIRLEDGVLAALASRDIHPSSDLLLRAAANDRIVYDGATGGLLFDRDGSGPGAGIQFATVSHGIALATPQG
jgi:serralysin